MKDCRAVPIAIAAMISLEFPWALKIRFHGQEVGFKRAENGFCNASVWTCAGLCTEMSRSI